ncbi:glutathione S-transferase family protein [Halomonas sp. SpR8]|uniref:glutathione S-transferase family protein n=1 Tax=Halomonas sp. SpR8 TaxID=3050463 RepID=UPI0035B38968
MKGEHLQQGFLTLNPAAKVLTLVDEGRAITESPAIQLYLAEKYLLFQSRWRREPRCTAGGLRVFRQGPARRSHGSADR